MNQIVTKILFMDLVWRMAWFGFLSWRLGFGFGFGFDVGIESFWICRFWIWTYWKMLIEGVGIWNGDWMDGWIGGFDV
jgi:hypothetical protein